MLEKISLATLGVQTLTFPAGFQELGAASIAVTPSGTAYFSTSDSGSGFTAVRSFSTSAPTFNPAVVLSDVPSGGSFVPVFTLSADGRYLLVAETADTGSDLYLIDASTGALLASKNAFFSDTNTGKDDVSGSAGLVADLTNEHMLVFDTSLNVVRDLTPTPESGDKIIGDHFNQDGSELFLWSELSQSLLVYSTTSWRQIASIPIPVSVTGPVPLGDLTGSMSLAANGRLLALNTGTGFEVIDLAPATHPSDFNADGKSDFLIENGVGAVVVGEVGSNNVAGYANVAALGPEWKFEGNGDFLNDGAVGFLIENTSGVVVVGETTAGGASYTQVAALGPEWSFKGVGDFLAKGYDAFMIENSAGAVVVGEIGASHQAAYIQVAAIGPEWSFRGIGDFFGVGHDEFLIENAVGAVVVGDVASGQAIFTQIAALGPEWNFRGTGDFLGDGKSDFLIENTAGVVVVGEVVNGVTQYTQIAGLGTEWKFVGTGDYLGEGHDQFLIENTAGAVDVGDWTGGSIHYTQVAGLGSEWAFH